MKKKSIILLFFFLLTPLGLHSQDTFDKTYKIENIESIVPNHEIDKTFFNIKKQKNIPYDITNDSKNWKKSTTDNSITLYYKINIKNNSSSDTNLILINSYNFYKQTVYYTHDNKIINNSSGYFQNSNKLYRLPSSRIILHPGNNIIYVKIISKFGLKPVFSILTENMLNNKIRKEQFILGVIFAILISMSLYNLFLFIVMRNKNHLYYVLYLLFTILFNINYLGLGHVIFGKYFFIVTGCWLHELYLSGFFLLLFTMNLLRLNKGHKKLYFFFNLLITIILLSSIIAAFTPFIALHIYNFFLLFTPFVFIGTGIYIFVKGYRPAIYFTLAYAVLLISSVFFNLTIQDIISWTYFGEWAYYFGVCSETILLSLALGDMIRLKEQNLLTKQSQYIDKLEKEEREKKHVYEQLSKIVYSHQINQIKKGKVLEETMPSSKASAIVIALDIINSSTLDHNTARKLFHEFFSKCYSRMYTGYNGEKMQSAAYRIKEMGDGFLCSIGYPFNIPDDWDKHATAINLIIDFLDDFDNICKNIGIEEKVFCAVGIAEGEVESYYPLVGTKEYDLYGNGIILAARYESLRKKIFKKGEINSHLIFAQNKIYNTLDENIKNKFYEYSLEETPIAEDPNAREVYISKSNLK